ncbi:N-acetylmuramoyl-L-alanine amidase [Fortiea sp. LEGE XX443]|uniref:peptidoglycan-binding protein n=1 Tax=Fortiea sp. LEGE XX443 TaxID=1828611 RepID=UPI00187E7218|nr:peptidoglycan-binding protein [Fortiea sp. LEGE XX443]MBE9004870.1 N-acetylmuramoyl-L-alanine amidase [Fortiea sp. LEGE XX443]
MSWQEFVEAVAQTEIEFPQLATACLAQAILESGRGTSDLAKLHQNYHGMKWRKELQGIAQSVYYSTNSEPTGGDTFCKFANAVDAVHGYWRFVDRAPYKGWRDHTNSAEDFFAFIGPIWCPPGYTDTWKTRHGGLVYHKYIMEKLYNEAQELLEKARQTQYQELKEGNRGEAVKLLQRELNEHLKAGLKVDGIFGSMTKQAVMEVEKLFSLTVDGMADVDVWKALQTIKPQIIDKHWIPFAQHPFDIPTKWTYEQGYPRGAVVHFTAGRDNPIGTLKYLGEVGFPCLVMGRDGVIYQGFPLNRGGSHSGTDHHRYSVGIEIVAAGRCEPVTVNGLRKFKAWFHKLPSEYFNESEMRYVEHNGSRREGWYHKYTPAQEESLIKLLLWLKSQAPDVFSFDDVKGHDECCDEGGRPGAKNDPGGALSMTMPEFRALLKQQYGESL